MYQKGTKASNYCALEQPKQKFQGNQYSNKDNEELGQSSTAKKLASATKDDVVYSPMH